MEAATVLSTLFTLAPEAKTLLLAVSGGGDSVALLRLLLGGPYRLHVAHFDHALRPESADEAQFVQSLCDTFSLPLKVQRAEVKRVAETKGWNLEDAARRLRYSFLHRTAKVVGADAIVTAHTQDDQAETVLLQLLRGSAYLKGMPARQGHIVRPLLSISRAELRGYLETIGQDWLEDPSNADTGRTRSWVRHEVLSLLERRYPAAKASFARHARVQRSASTYLEGKARELFVAGGLASAPLRNADPALRLTALALLLRDAGVAADLAHLERLEDALSRTSPLRVALPGGALARLAYGKLEVLSAASSRVPQPVEPALTLPTEVDADKLSGERLFYRTRLPGDWLCLPAGRKKLSDLLIDAKVPREDRDALRLLATDPTEPSEILWVEGVMTSVRAARAASDTDIPFMKRALVLAAAAAAAGEVPVGAVITRSGGILAEAANTSRSDNDPSAHAELKAIREAAYRLGNWRLTDCTLYVTLEPCPMCFGALLAAHLPRLVYGAENRREGALGGVADLQQHPWKRDIAVRSGVMAKEAAALLSDFFLLRRDALR